MNLDKVLAQMRQQHEELGIAIRVFDRLTNGHHTKKHLSAMERASALIASTHGEEAPGKRNGHKPSKKKPQSKKYMRESWHQRQEREKAAVVEPLSHAEHQMIAGAIDKGMSFTAALVAGLKAAPRPLFSTELGPILRERGVVTEKGGNKASNKGVGVLAAAYARRGQHNIIRTEDNRYWVEK